MFTEEFLEELITCSKIVVDAPSEMRSGRSGFMKRSFTLKSADGIHSFSGFINQNLTFTENFSVGLVFNPPEAKGTITLMRCNGSHGGTVNHPHHAYCHIHTSHVAKLNEGIKSESKIEITDEYASVEEAIQYYINRINISSTDKIKYFPPPSGQIDLFN